MVDFVCSVCNKSFSLPQSVLDKYPNWQPKYCMEHSPKKKKTSSTETAYKGSKTKELDLTLEEVLSQFSEGPHTGIFTDGSARPNPGPGGWGVVIVKNGEVVAQKYGDDKQTTNNKMELTALIEAYQMAPANEPINLYTDSELSINILTKWAKNWEKNGWKKKDGEIKNLELVKKVYQLYNEKQNVNLNWIKAHNGWLWNEYADSLATAWARENL